ncbi:SAM hydrolase/SAM-dependent halogenase family protein [Sneathiella chinensis]|uniref:SAM-dependent chlorinase/fluorinase n=1 Tax=Sneathiella chinensis TaxID=349750 RepID=A0ABQ5U162_9PROT|nr:SAM-dependent chlorinase/fluorinase [Sneathiella chinensis]GLQ05458.1 hypothetical protein GCM10007924_06790 [Sneathiella chinensis]
MILLFTDFGAEGPYLAQMTARLRRAGYTGEVLSLFADAPVFSPKASGYLLAAYMADFERDSVFLSVVDPGVGGHRKPVVVRSQGRWFVGPDNGLFSRVVAMDAGARAWEIVWRPDQLSNSFHGRDLFAPVAARLAMGDAEELLVEIPTDSLAGKAVPSQLAEVIYVDRYGNVMTGLDAGAGVRALIIGGTVLPLETTFSSVPEGEPLAYLNANGLIEIAVNKGRADDFFGLSVGDSIAFD